MKQNFEQIFETDTLKILETEKIDFSRDESGFLNLIYDGEKYERVTLTRLVPYVDSEKYISVNYNKEHDEWTEIGVIDDVSLLPKEQAKVVREYLAFKYYIPVITKITKITDNHMGYLFLEAQTSAGEKKIAVNDWWHNFKVISGTSLAVTDADGNRYSIPAISELDKASLKKLQLFI